MPGLLEIPTLTDGTLTLRAHTDVDVDAVLERCVDPESVRWTTVPVEYTREMAVEYLAHLGPSSEQISWAIELGGAYAGTIDLRSWGETPEGKILAGDLGFVTHPAVRGRGVMGRAVELVVGHAFDTLGWHTVIWQANVGNVASYKPAWRCGFPTPTFVPSLLVNRGRVTDGWHSPLHRDDPREPAVAWEAVARVLDSHMRRATRPG